MHNHLKLQFSYISKCYNSGTDGQSSSVEIKLPIQFPSNVKITHLNRQNGNMSTYFLSVIEKKSHKRYSDII